MGIDFRGYKGAWDGRALRAVWIFVIYFFGLFGTVTLDFGVREVLGFEERLFGRTIRKEKKRKQNDASGTVQETVLGGLKVPRLFRIVGLGCVL